MIKHRVRRRSSRLNLRVPVRIYGRTVQDQPFRELTETLGVNAYGARIELSTSLDKGQKVLLVHGITEQERECRVVEVQPAYGERWKVGLEFLKPQGNFWQVFQPLRPASAEASVEREDHVE